MKTASFLSRKHLSSIFLTGLLLCMLLPSALAALPPMDNSKEYQPVSGEFDAVGKAVVQLLQTRNAAQFATNVSVSAEDWQSLITTDLTAEEQERIKGFGKGANSNRQRAEASAKALLVRADSLHLDFSKGELPFHIITPKHFGKVFFSNPNAGRLAAPYLEKLEIILNLTAAAGPTNQGEFKLTVRGLEKFPGGWRINDGIQWTSFPTNVADEKTLRELAILEKIAAHKGFTGQDDPALLKFGESLVRFVRTGDTNLYEKEAREMNITFSVSKFDIFLLVFW